MAFNNTLTITGNVTRAVEVKKFDSGKQIAKFGVAVNRRFTRKGEQIEDVSFFDVVAFGSLADNVIATVTKGMRVIVAGELRQERWEDAEKQNRSRVRIYAESIGVELRFGTASFTPNDRQDGGSQPPDPEEPY